MKSLARVEITVQGLVQGVGFRYYVLRIAVRLNITGYVKNLYNGDVLTIAEGDKEVLESFIKEVIKGPTHSRVSKYTIDWSEYKSEFSTFEIRH